jgi:CRISPR/Cas system-associated exonuclease Cas4 (RecB family)
VLEIYTIDDFYALGLEERTAILKALRSKMRLEDWLRARNGKAKRNFKKKFWMKCPKCRGDSGFWSSPRDGRDIHPSQIHRCIKKLWFDCSYTDQIDKDGDPVPYFMYAEEYIDPQLQLIFMMGHHVHDIMQELGRQGAWGSKEAYSYEVEIDPDAKDENGKSIFPHAESNWIKGAVDAVLSPYIIKVEGLGDVAIRVIHEYKSINSSSYAMLNQPKSEHKWQATIYSKVLNVPIVVYMYMNKDNCQIADFPIPFDHSMWRTIEEKITTVQHHTEVGAPPPWEMTSAVLSPRECQSCPYVKLCNPPQPDVKRRR